MVGTLHTWDRSMGSHLHVHYLVPAGGIDPQTGEWNGAGLITDSHRFVISEDAPPGTYQIEIGLYAAPGFDRLSVVETDGAEGADRLLLGPLQVER